MVIADILLLFPDHTPFSFAPSVFGKDFPGALLLRNLVWGDDLRLGGSQSADCGFIQSWNHKQDNYQQQETKRTIKTEFVR